LIEFINQYMSDFSSSKLVTAGMVSLIWCCFVTYQLQKIATIQFLETCLLLFISILPLAQITEIFDLPSGVFLPSFLIAVLTGAILRKSSRKIGALDSFASLATHNSLQRSLVRIEKLEDLHNVDTLVFSESEMKSINSDVDEALKSFLAKALQLNQSVFVESDFLENNVGWVQMEDDSSIVKVRFENLPVLRLLKQIFDTTLAVILLVLAVPFIIFVSLVMLLVEGRPIFYTQERMGKGKAIFRILKFRTLRPPNPNVREEKEQLVTFGGLLRTLHFDEVPQLLNIIWGEMAFIGPRPEWILLTTPEKAPPNYWLRTTVRPGLTGWAQVNYLPSNSKEMRRMKLGYDLYYINNRSVLLDMLIWLRTIIKVLKFSPEIR